MQNCNNKNYNSIALFILTIAIFYSSEISAQTEIYGFGGYMTYSSVYVAEGTLSFNDGFNYGFGLDVPIDRGMFVELNYTHNQTSTRLRRHNGITEPLFDMNTHYFQVGALYEVKKGSNQKAYPYGLLTLGATMFHPQDPKLSDEWFFSVSLGGGGKINLSKSVGLRLQARLLLPLVLSGGGLWCGTGGCGVGVGTWANLVQFDFTAGVFIRLGK